MEFVIALLVVGAIPALIAHAKGHPSLPWFIYGALLFPVALVHSIVVDRKPDLSARRSRVPTAESAFRPDGVYNGVPYRVRADGSIEGMLTGGLVRFAGETDFFDAVGLADGTALATRELRHYQSFIAGIEHEAPDGRDRRKYIQKTLQPGMPLDLVPEPDNPYDEFAVAIMHRGFHLGFVPRKHHWIAAALLEGRDVAVTVERIVTRGWIFEWVWRVDLRVSVLAH